MPVTPLHYPIAKLLSLLDGKAVLSLPALIIGSMVPDLEVPFVYWWSGTWAQDRMVLHSLVGGLTLGTAIAVLLTVFLYSPVIGGIFPVDKKRIKEKCAFSYSLIFSGFLGVLSHVLLDVVNHQFNPLLWPFLSIDQTPSPIVPLLGGVNMASLITHGVMIAIFVALLIKYRHNFWEQLLVG